MRVVVVWVLSIVVSAQLMIEMALFIGKVLM